MTALILFAGALAYASVVVLIVCVCISGADADRLASLLGPASSDETADAEWHYALNMDGRRP